MFEELDKYNEISQIANKFIINVSKTCTINQTELKWYHVIKYLIQTQHVEIEELPEKIRNINSQEYGIYGVTMRDNEDTVILYNQKNIKLRQHFTLMHEVGHYILHNDKNNPTYTSLVLDNEYSEEDLILEKEANMMAGMLLANKKAIKSLLNDRKPYNYLCKYFGISKTALKIRLFNLFYFQTMQQILNEEKEIEDPYAYSHKTINNYIYYNYKLTIN